MTTYPIASVRSPASSVPASAMLVTMKPKGTRRRIGRRRRNSAPRQAILIGDGSPIEPHPNAPDRQLVAEAQCDGPVDAVSVDVRAICAPLVLHEPAAAAEGEHRVIGANEIVLDKDRVVHVAPDRVDRPQGDGAAVRRLVGWRLEDREAPDPGARADLRVLGAAQVAQQ